MKIQVTLNSTYKWALVEETYLVDVTEYVTYDDDNSDRTLK